MDFEPSASSCLNGTSIPYMQHLVETPIFSARPPMVLLYHLRTGANSVDLEILCASRVGLEWLSRPQAIYRHMLSLLLAWPSLALGGGDDPAHWNSGSPCAQMKWKREVHWGHIFSKPCGSCSQAAGPFFWSLKPAMYRSSPKCHVTSTHKAFTQSVSFLPDGVPVSHNFVAQIQDPEPFSLYFF